MPVKKNSGRQEVIRAYVDIAYSDLVSGAAAEAIDLPVGAQVVDGEIVRDTAFNSATSDNIVVGDSGVANRYLASTSIATTGRVALTPTGFRTTSATRKVTVTWTGVGAVPTAGQLRLGIGYIVNNRAAFTQD